MDTYRVKVAYKSILPYVIGIIAAIILSIVGIILIKLNTYGIMIGVFVFMCIPSIIQILNELILYEKTSIIIKHEENVIQIGSEKISIQDISFPIRGANDIHYRIKINLKNGKTLFIRPEQILNPFIKAHLLKRNSKIAAFDHLDCALYELTANNA